MSYVYTYRPDADNYPKWDERRYPTGRILIDDTIYDNASSLKDLLSYPSLLMRWALEHPEDVKRVATIASHKLHRHKFCETEEKCLIVEKFISK